MNSSSQQVSLRGEISTPGAFEITRGIFLPLLRRHVPESSPVILICKAADLLGLDSLGCEVSVEGKSILIKELSVMVLEVERLTFLTEKVRLTDSIDSSHGTCYGIIETISSVQSSKQIGVTGSFFSALY